MRCGHLLCDPEQMPQQVEEQRLRTEHISEVPDGGEVQNQEIERNNETGASVEQFRERDEEKPTEKFNILQSFLYGDKYSLPKGREYEGRQGNVDSTDGETQSPLQSQGYARKMEENNGNCGGEWKGITYNDVYEFHQREEQAPFNYGDRVRNGKTELGMKKEKNLWQSDNVPFHQTEAAGSNDDGFFVHVVNQQQYDSPEPALEENRDEHDFDYDYDSYDYVHHHGAKEGKYDEEYDYKDSEGPDHDYTDSEEHVYGSELLDMMYQYSTREGDPDDGKQGNKYIKSYVGGHIKTQEEEPSEE